MYFVKPKKHLEEQDGKERQEKSRRERYQRSDSARLLLQQSKAGPSQSEEGRVPKHIPTAQTSLDGSRGASHDPSSDFKPEELPDGAFYRPKKDLTKLQTTTEDESVQSGGVAAGSKTLEHTRPAEYIGTFSVSGSDKESRERHMESQLEQMRTARDRRPVNLIISNTGVKVILHENNNVFMEHSLKRIWYATCDPEYCQFSFLAREPKTSAEVQYCHAFVTQTSQQAEELISIMGEAFRSTDNEAKKPPTFHELIEQQVQQQQARYRETEQEAKNALEQKLKEIATPTPFSERAQYRMEQRRKSEDISALVDQEKILVEQQAARQPLSVDKLGSSVRGNRRSEIPTRQSTPQSSPLKRNSVPPQAAVLPSLVPSTASSLSILAIKESLESKSSNSKFKGSPVTALKNEIDRRLSMVNGDDLPPPVAISLADLRKDLQAKPQKPQPKAMLNRPLPLPPNPSRSPQQTRHNTGAPQLLQQSQPLQLQHPQQPHHAFLRHSLDDYHLPRSSSSQIPLSSNARSGAGNVVLRDSPKRRPPRPMSEIATSSSAAAGAGIGEARDFTEQQQQQQQILNNFGANFSLSTLAEVGADGSHSRRPSGAADLDVVLSNTRRESARKLAGGDDGQAGDVAGGGDGLRHVFKKSDSRRSPDPGLSQIHQNITQSSSSKAGLNLGQPGHSSRLASYSEQDTLNVTVPRYQNDSPFQNDRSERVLKQPSGGGKPEDHKSNPASADRFDSLMCMDRSHIHDETLRNAVWYQAGLPREIALEILQQEEVGSFIVRDSSSHPGCYALSVRVPKFENSSGISHYLILRTHRGVKLKGLDKEWTTLTALVTHHTVLRELLPCTLRLPKSKGQESASSRGHGAITISNEDGSQEDKASYSES